MTITEQQAHILHHTLGLTPDRREPYRNYFVAGPGHHSMPDLEVLEQKGLVERRTPPAFLRQGDYVFAVTDEGRDIALFLLPDPPRRTKYDEYLRADCCESFAEWLGIDVPQVEWQGSTCRYVRKRFRGFDFEIVAGDWKPTKKQAKASYKQALRAGRVAA